MKILHLCCALILSFIFLYIIFCIYMRIRFPVFLTQTKKKELYEGMNKVHNILNENNIPYFAICGTLLGVIRDREIIPWDDDIDIGILSEDMDRFNNIDFTKYNLFSRPVTDFGIGKVFTSPKMDTYIDIFAFRKNEKDNVYEYVHESARKAWPNEYFKTEELFPLKLYNFDKIKIQGPNKFEPYAKRSWGNWEKPVFKIPKIFLYPIDFGRIYMTKKYNVLKDEK